MTRDERIAQQIQNAIDCCTVSISQRDSQYERIMKKAQERPQRRIALVPALACLLLAVTMTVAIAEAFGINVFALFGQRNERYAALAPQSLLEACSVITVDSAGAGQAAITNAYYDGQTLLIAYGIANGRQTESFVPDEAFLARMTRSAENPLADEDAGADWENAIRSGVPAGLVLRTVTADDQTWSEEGEPIPAVTETEALREQDTAYFIREYELPETLRNQEQLSCYLGLAESVRYVYFDGTAYYFCAEHIPLAPMRATVWNTHADILQMSGSGAYQSIPVQAEATVSAASVVLTLRLAEPLPPLPQDHWYHLALQDENGAFCRPRGGLNGDLTENTLVYDGTGTLPQHLSLYILVESEGEWSRDQAIQNSVPIKLIH